MHCRSVDVDPDAMSEALLNCCQNALRYTGDEKQIAMRAASKRDNEVHHHRSTTGPAFRSHEQCAHLREILSRRRSGATRTSRASGLGLAIVHQIVRAHRGRSHRRERHRQGRDVSHLLPAALPREQSRNGRDHPDRRGRSLDLARPADEPRARGLPPVAAHDGEEALELARSHKPDLIVLDLMLPKLERARRDPRSCAPTIPTRRSSCCRRRIKRATRCWRCRSAPTTTSPSPFGVAELIARIRAALRRRRRRGARRRRSTALRRRDARRARGGAFSSRAARSSRRRASSTCSLFLARASGHRVSRASS